MTYKKGGSVYIVPEGKTPCDLCGEIAELRPYGPPNNERICFSCGMKDPETTSKKFNEFVDGPDTVPDN